MKRLCKISLIWLLVMTLIPINVMATEDADREKAKKIASAIAEMSRQEEVAELMNLLNVISDDAAFIDTFVGALSEIADSGETIRKTSLVFAGALDFYDGSNMDQEKIVSELMTLRDDSKDLEKAIGMDEETILYGIDRMDYFLGLLGAVSALDLEWKKILTIDEAHDKIAVNEANIETFANNVAVLTQKSSTDVSGLVNNFSKFETYFEKLSEVEKEAIFEYLNKYGFISVDGKADAMLEAPAFDDLSSVDWAKEGIIILYKNGIIKGKSDTSFDPEGDIIRAEFAALIVRLIELNGTSDKAFEDVGVANWYNNAVQAVVKSGYIKGVADNRFAPLDEITREQIATILGRIMIDKGVTPLTEDEMASALAKVNDANEIEVWAKEGAALMIHYDIFVDDSGVLGQSFGPKVTATRAEVAEMLYRLTKHITTSVQE